MRDQLKKIDEELYECLDALEKHPVQAAYYLGKIDARIEFISLSLKEEEETDE
jgi:hypothetical protein